MRDLEDEKRIKEYMAAKMTHIKMYNECMNLADGLDVAKFAELVRADEREACAEIAEKMGNKMKEGYEKTNDLIFKFNCYALEACAISIRARGDK